MVKWCPGAAWTVCRVFTPPSSTKCLYGVPGGFKGTRRHGTGCWCQPNFHRTIYTVSLGDPVHNLRTLQFI